MLLGHFKEKGARMINPCPLLTYGPIPLASLVPTVGIALISLTYSI